MPPLKPPDPPLTDGVVALRGVHEADCDQVVRALRDPEIVRWIRRIPADYTPADFDYWLGRHRAAAAAGDGLTLAVVAADDHHRVLGSVGVHELRSGRPDIGYWVAPDARGRGVAPRAARLLRDHAVERLGVGRIEVLVDPGNAASQRAAEKAGFTRTGEYRRSPRGGDDDERDLVVFAWPDDGGAGGGAG
jgi:RimJ/RimL family protein N-acetyltransferase